MTQPHSHTIKHGKDEPRPLADIDTSRLCLVADSLDVISCLLLDTSNGKRRTNLQLIDPDQFASLLGLLSREMRDAGGGEI